MSRPYRMRKRAEHVDSTRLRIVEATVALHGTVGPAATTVWGVAELAGVTRATVYRHFPDEGALFQACSRHWLAKQVEPDPRTWAQVRDPAERLRTGLADLYRFYRDGEAMLTRIFRDKAVLPEAHRRGLDAREQGFRDALLAAFPAATRRRRTLRAVVGHAVSFWTWRSLCVDNGLGNREAVEAMVRLVLSTAGGTGDPAPG